MKFFCTRRGLLSYVLLLLVEILFLSQPAVGAPHRRRGDKYILGVGKADITG